MILSTLFGSDSAVKTLLFVENYEEGYCSEISKTYKMPASMIQKQLDKFEAGGILVARTVGRTRVYQFNPRFYFLKELKALLRKAIESLPKEQQKEFFRNRKRPRRKGKPL